MDLTLPLRGLQALFLLIVLALAGYGKFASRHVLNCDETNSNRSAARNDGIDSPSEINFLIFTVRTICVLPWSHF